MPHSDDLEQLKASLPPEWKNVPVLSFSQVTKADRCSFSWYLHYHLRYKSKGNRQNMDRGTFVHRLLKDLYDSFGLGLLPADWFEVRFPDAVQEILADGLLHDQANSLSRATNIISRYCQLPLNGPEPSIFSNHTPVGAEQHFYVLVTLDSGRRFVLQGYVDLITIDALNRVWVWDHKTGENFWPPLRSKMFIQNPIYQIILRADGIPVYGTAINFLRTYDYKKGLETKKNSELFKREWDHRTEAELSSIWQEFCAMAEHVLDLMEGKVPARRSIRDDDCYKCDMLIPCHANLIGEPLEQAIELYNKHQIAVRNVPVGTGVTLITPDTVTPDTVSLEGQ